VIGSIDARISSLTHGVKHGPAVYFLWRGSEVVYTGQSINVVKRICEHACDKDFDRSSFEQINGNDLTFVESYMIWFLRPKYNKHVPLLGSLGCCYRGNLKKRSVEFVCKVLAKSLPIDRVLDLFVEADDMVRTNATNGRSPHYRKLLLSQARRNEKVRQLVVRFAQEATDGQ
jgi:hypothetical protein